MATTKSISSRVYRSGKPVGKASSPAVPAPAVPQFTPKLSDAWNWMPRHRLLLLVDQAVAQAKLECTPPDGEPFILDGDPYACKSDFAESLVYQFKELVYGAVAGLDGPDAPANAITASSKSS